MVNISFGSSDDPEIRSIRAAVIMAGGDKNTERSMIVEHLLNKELLSKGIEDRKFYLFRNQRRKEIFWIFLFQRSQIRWYRSMEIELSSKSEESEKAIKMEKLQSEKSIGFFNFLKNERRIKEDTSKTIDEIITRVLDG